MTRTIDVVAIAVKRQQMAEEGATQIIIPPPWLPAPVLRRLEQMLAADLPNRDMNLLCRLASDERMKVVWTELARHQAREVHCAFAQRKARQNQSVVQEDALADALHFAFVVARTGVPTAARVRAACVGFFERHFGLPLEDTAAVLATVATGRADR